MSVLQHGEARFFDVTQDDVPGFGTYKSDTLFTGGLSPSAAHTAGLSSQFASTSRRFGNNASERKANSDYDKCKLSFRGPGTHEVVPYRSFDCQSQNPKRSGVKMGTVSDSVRPLTTSRDEREGIAAPGSYNLGSCFDRAARSSDERSGKGSSAFCNSGRQQEFTPDGKNVVCMPRAYGLNGESLGPGSYTCRNKNWTHWRDSRVQQSNESSARGCTPHARHRNRFPDESIAHTKRRPRRMIKEGHTSVRPGTSPQRGTYYGLYSGMV